MDSPETVTTAKQLEMQIKGLIVRIYDRAKPSSYSEILSLSLDEENTLLAQMGSNPVNEEPEILLGIFDTPIQLTNAPTAALINNLDQATRILIGYIPSPQNTKVYISKTGIQLNKRGEIQRLSQQGNEGSLYYNRDVIGTTGHKFEAEQIAVHYLEQLALHLSL